VLLTRFCGERRALDSFKQLLSDKAHCLAHPDILISAVGTKVYKYTPDKGWQEDKGWGAQLDVGWRVQAVREAAYAALANVSEQWVRFTSSGATALVNQSTGLVGTAGKCSCR
jgi:hypothetical protein